MRNVGYITTELSLLCKEYKDIAKDAANKGRAERIIEQIQKLIEELAESDRYRFNTDSVFFAGELNHHGQEYETLYPGDEHRDADDDSEESNGGKTGGHGNTKLPYGLCEKYGIEVQKGWTPRDAWAALAGKGVSAAEEYKKLKERGRAESTQKASASLERHSAAKKSLTEKQDGLRQQQKDLHAKAIEARNREIDIRYGKLSQSKNALTIAEQESTKAKKRKDDIAGRSKEQIEADMNESLKKVQEASELNNKFYERPGRHDPERPEWDAWCEAHGGRQAILDTINRELYDKDGAKARFDRDERLFNREYDKYGPDGGYKEARKKVRDCKKQVQEHEAELADIEKEIQGYDEQEKALGEGVRAARQEYYDAVKERFPTFEDCKTASDVAERLTAEGIFDGDDVMCKFSDTISTEVAMSQAKALTSYLDKVPFLKGHCHRLNIHDTAGENYGGYDYSNVYGYSSSDEVVLNEKHYKDPEKMKEDWQYDIDQRFHPPGTTPESVIHHEYSHQLDDYLTKELSKSGTTFSLGALKEVSRRLGMTTDECKAAVSGYSVKNHSGEAVEWFAEAMSEYTSSANPRPIAKALGDYVMECAEMLKEHRHDAADDDGRWVTTENDHRVHINEEGIPDKGNPYVLATMRGEGPNPKSREELARHRVQKKSRQVKALFQALEDAERDEEDAYDARGKALNALRRLEMERKIVENHKELFKKLGYGEGSKEVMQSDLEDLKNQMDDILQGRSKWDLKPEEKEPFQEIEAKYNQIDFALKGYDDVYGPDAFSEEKVRQAEEDAERAKKKAHEATVRRERAHKEAHAVTGKLDQEKFMTGDERSSTIQNIQNSSVWGDMSDEAKAKSLEVIQNASDAHLLLLQKTMGSVRINDGHGRTSGGAESFYSKGTGAITMSQSDMQRPEVVWHEYGHFLDDPDESDCYSRKKKNSASGMEHKYSLSQALYDDNVMHSKEVADDINKFLQESGIEGYTIQESPYGNYLGVFNSEGGSIESSSDMAFFKISSAFDDAFSKFQFSDSEYDDYLRSIGCPLDSEEPNYRDYIEIYHTPKRGLTREREKYKGAREEYQKAYREFRDKRDAAIKQHTDEFIQKSNEYQERCHRRAEMIGPVSDILCGVFNGRGPWISGGHSEDYYSRSTAPYSEAVANYHQMRMMGWTEGLNLLKSIAPSVHDGLEKAYDEWMWRNIDV